MRKLLVTLPVLIALSTASAQPNYQVGPFLFAISNRGWLGLAVRASIWVPGAL